MASSPKPAPKTASRWGFISQAVASVESRLDTILNDDEVPTRKPTSQPIVPKENVPQSRGSMESTRSGSVANDRLQERLAKAMAKKSSLKVDSPGTSEPVSRASTPGIASHSVLASVEGDEDNISSRTEDTRGNVQPPQNETNHIEQAGDLCNENRDSVDSAQNPHSETSSQRVSRDIARSSMEQVVISRPSEDVSVTSVAPQPQLDHEDTKIATQKEIDGYIERIDALNAKLQYLTKEAVIAAKDATLEANPESLEKRLSEKDEKIALLMEEGQKLSMAEMRHLNTIKKLRTQSLTSNKDQDTVKQRAERAEQAAKGLEERAKRAEALAKSAEAKWSEANKRSKELEGVNREKIALNQTLIDIRVQLTKANARAESAESKVRSDQIEAENKRVAELKDDLSSARVERELSEDKLRQEIKELKASLESEKEQSRVMESGMLAEQAALETKLESVRVRAEEASANDHGDTQAKLLRQIETLQSQYAAASQNWQGIEGTLVARISTLEKERDDLSTREADVRRKLRDATTKAKSTGKELEDVQLNYATLQETQSDVQMETQRLNRRNQQLEDDLARTQREFEEQKVKLERDYNRRLEDERSRWAASVQLARTESPTVSSRKTSTYDTNHLGNPYMDRPVSRRSSTLASALASVDSHYSTRQYSTSSSRHINNGSGPETPILVTTDPDEYFTGVPATPGSPDHPSSRRGAGDLISTSTVGAGPSVQLVERMSANVRRLESEKAASKDELNRITSQRDESRTEVVRLMREVEQKQRTEQLLKKLEEEHKVLSERHQTTLELLGEKSEQVEELEADILDVKQMYRQLADQMK